MTSSARATDGFARALPSTISDITRTSCHRLAELVRAQRIAQTMISELYCASEPDLAPGEAAELRDRLIEWIAGDDVFVIGLLALKQVIDSGRCAGDHQRVLDRAGHIPTMAARDAAAMAINDLHFGVGDWPPRLLAWFSQDGAGDPVHRVVSACVELAIALLD